MVSPEASRPLSADPGESRPSDAASEVLELLLPNGEALRRHVDHSGRRRLDELPDGSWLRYRYDVDGNPATVEHSGGERVDYAVCDGSWVAASSGARTTIRLDPEGLPAGVEQRVGGVVLTVDYRLDRHGRHRAVRYPGSPAWLELVPDGPRAVALRIGGLTYARAEADGAATTVTFGNGATTVETLAGGHLVEVSVCGSDGAKRATGLTRDREGAITSVAGRTARHDGDGRLAGLGADRWAYDADGRLVSGPGREVGYGSGPQACATTTRERHTAYVLDRLGRRVAAQAVTTGGDETVTSYRYDLFGQLVAVDAPTASVRYVHDGFGRLVTRDDGSGLTHHLIGIDGHRLVDVDAHGRVVASYLWLGEQCVGRVDGPLGGPLAASFHRDPTGRPLAWGDGAGLLHDEPAGDAFGAGSTPNWERPGLAGLFGDPSPASFTPVPAGSTRRSPSSSRLMGGSARTRRLRCRRGCAACSMSSPAGPTATPVPSTRTPGAGTPRSTGPTRPATTGSA